MQIQKRDVSFVVCTTPSGNRTRVSPVAGAYSTTRPTVLRGCESSSSSMLTCRIACVYCSTWNPIPSAQTTLSLYRVSSLPLTTKGWNDISIQWLKQSRCHRKSGSCSAWKVQVLSSLVVVPNGIMDITKKLKSQVNGLHLNHDSGNLLL